MKVLLCEDIDKLGWFGDIVDVNNGYARNYLLPQGLVTVPTQANIKAMAQEKTKRAEERIQQRKHLESAAKKVEGAEAVIAVKTNELGHLFGSVSVKEVAENLRAQGFEVADKVVNLGDHIKEVGTYTVKLKFAFDLIAKVSLVVVSDAPAQEDEQDAQDNQEDKPKEDQ